jgi:hypothetical protein
LTYVLLLSVAILPPDLGSLAETARFSSGWHPVSPVSQPLPTERPGMTPGLARVSNG